MSERFIVKDLVVPFTYIENKYTCHDCSICCQFLFIFCNISRGNCVVHFYLIMIQACCLVLIAIYHNIILFIIIINMINSQFQIKHSAIAFLQWRCK